MTNARIELTCGPLEVRCEASEEFISQHLLAIMQGFVELDIQDIPAVTEPTGCVEQSLEGARAQVPKLSTTDFAVRMGAKSGSDLVMAAAAYLHHTLGQEEFRRSDILGQMKAAKAFYKASYGSNLSKSLEMLTKSGRLGNPRPESFTLPYAEIESTSAYLK